MNDTWRGLSIVVISGVLTYILSQLFTEFVLRPIQEYKILKAKVAKQLVLYAQYYANPAPNTDVEKYPRWSAASDEIRELAAEVAAFTEIKPRRWFVFYAIPKKQDLLEASSNLIGLSNAFFTTGNFETHSRIEFIEYRKTIKKKMRITERKE